MNAKKIIVGSDTLKLSDEKTPTMAVAGDLKLKADIVGIGAEAYWGKNLTMLFSNAYLRSEKSGKQWKIKGTETMGGWGEVSVAPKNTKVTFNLGAGLEKLKEEEVDSLIADIAFGVAKPLWKNRTIFANVILTPIEKVTFAFEFNNITSTYKLSEKGAIKEKDAKDNCVNFAFKFDF